MKTMYCKQLGGPDNCTEKFTADTFKEIAELSKNHGMEMFQNGDGPHMEAAKKMQELMNDPASMEKWYNKRKKEFESLPDK